jgi:polyferredoxin
MGKLGKPSLVTWSSDFEIVEQKGKTQFFRAKVLAYIGLLVGLMVILGVMGSTKENMLLNINKETRLYSTKLIKTGEDKGKIRVDNAYEFLLQNTQNEKMKFYFEVIPPKGMKGKIFIAKPSKEFTAVPGIKKKKIVVLRTTELLADDDRKDTIIPITIRAYAIGHEDKIVVFRKSTFIFPKADILKKAK